MKIIENPSTISKKINMDDLLKKAVCKYNMRNKKQSIWRNSLSVNLYDISVIKELDKYNFEQQAFSLYIISLGSRHNYLSIFLNWNTNNTSLKPKPESLIFLDLSRNNFFVGCSMPNYKSY